MLSPPQHSERPRPGSAGVFPQFHPLPATSRHSAERDYPSPKHSPGPGAAREEEEEEEKSQLREFLLQSTSHSGKPGGHHFHFSPSGGNARVNDSRIPQGQHPGSCSGPDRAQNTSIRLCQQLVPRSGWAPTPHPRGHIPNLSARCSRDRPRGKTGKKK